MFVDDPPKNHAGAPVRKSAELAAVSLPFPGDQLDGVRLIPSVLTNLSGCLSSMVCGYPPIIGAGDLQAG